MRTMPNAAADLKLMAQEKILWLDKLMDGKEFICGKRFTLADIMLFCFMNFAATVGQGLSPEAKNLVSWFEKVNERPSSSA